MAPILRLTELFAVTMLSAASLLWIPAAAQAPELGSRCPATEAGCSCPGDVDAILSQGGDQDPLTWQSLPCLVREGDTRGAKPLYCYDYSVQNHSVRDVRKIYWREVNFYRKVIAAGRLNSNCPFNQGSRSDYLLEALLHYGTSNNPYFTNVYTPDKTWSQTSISDDDLAEDHDGESMTLVSRIVVDIEGKSGDIQQSEVIITSELTKSPELTLLRYEFYNRGEHFIDLYINIPKNPSVDEVFPYSSENPLFLIGFGKTGFEIPISDEIIVDSVSVVIWDELLDVAAIGTAGMYVIKDGRKELNDEKIWDMTNGRP